MAPRPRRSSGALTAITVIAALLATSACSPPTVSGSDDPGPVMACNPVALSACGLPFPSDLYTVSDPLSPTGKRVQVGDNLVSEGYLSQVPDSMSPSEVLNGASGFSAAGPVLFELDSPAASSSLPGDGGEAFMVFDTTTGHRVAIRAETDPEAATTAQPSPVVRAWPAVRFEHGHHYLAVITTALQPEAGGTYTPSSGFREVIDGAETGAARHFEPLLELLAGHGVDRRNLLSATDFTVRAEHDVQGRLLEPLAEADSRAHAVRIHRVEASDKLAGAMTVYGLIELTNFQNPLDGSFDGSTPGRPYWTTFQLVVPAEAATNPAPVAIYGHGYGGNKTRMIEFLGDNDAAGIATIGIDWSNRGSRVVQDRGYVMMLDEPAEQARVAGMMPQGVLDVASVRRALATSLADLDVQPAGGDGTADLDPARVIYEGTSYGGLLGAAALGALDDVDGGILHVCGIGLMDTLGRTPIWPLQKGIIPRNGPGTDAALGVALLQHAVDPADGANWAHTYRTPVPDDGARAVLLQYGQDDSWVHNEGSEALISLAGLPEVVQPLPETSSPFQEGYGWQMISNDGSVPEWAWGMYAHALSTTTPAARAVTAAWLAEYRKGRSSASAVGTVPDDGAPEVGYPEDGPT